MAIAVAARVGLPTPPLVKAVRSRGFIVAGDPARRAAALRRRLDMRQKRFDRGLELSSGIVTFALGRLLALRRQGHLDLLPPLGTLVVGSVAGAGWPIVEKYLVFAALMAAFLADGSAIWPAAFIS